MGDELLRPTEVGRRLGIPTREVVALLHARRLRFVLRRGLLHVPAEALDELRRQPPT